MKFKKKIFLSLIFLALFPLHALKADYYSDFFAEMVLKKDHQLMKNRLGLVLKPVFSGLSSNTFPAVAAENFGFGLSSSFVDLPLEKQDLRLESSIGSAQWHDQGIPLVTAYGGAKIFYYDLRFWLRGVSLPPLVSGLSRDLTLIGGGLGKEFKFFDFIPLLSPSFSVGGLYHSILGFPGIDVFEQVGVNATLALRVKFLVSVKPFLSMGVFFNRWKAFFDSDELDGFNFSHSLKSKLESSRISLALADSNYSFPVAAGLRFSLGVLDFFGEYSFSPEQTFSVATGLSF